jgi:hypothetical protein
MLCNVLCLDFFRTLIYYLYLVAFSAFVFTFTVCRILIQPIWRTIVIGTRSSESRSVNQLLLPSNMASIYRGP